MKTFASWLSGFILLLQLFNSSLQAQTCPGSLLFNATNPAVNLPSSNLYYTGANGGYTWECWFMLNQPLGPNVKPLISALDGVLFEDMYLGFGWQGGWFNVPVTDLVFKVDGPNSAFPTQPNCSYAPPGGFLTGVWYHAAGVMDYTNQLATLYLNGLPVDTKTITTAPITRVIPAELSFNWSNTPLPLEGNMDEVRIWTRPLTSLEILTNYNQCLNGNELNLFVYYRCNQPGGATVTDATANNNTGTFAIAQNWSALDAGLTGTTCAMAAGSLSVSSTGSMICAGAGATLIASGAGSYTWSTGATTSSIVVWPGSTTSYSVWGSVATCSAAATASAVMTVTVNPTSMVTTFVTNPQICSGSTTTLYAFGAQNYTWSTGATTSSIMVSPPVTTSYSVYGAPCSNTANPAVVTITVTPLPVILTASLNPALCSNSTVTLTASGASFYIWNPGAVAGSSLVVAASPAMVYSVTGTSFAGCTSTGTINVTAPPAFSIGILSNPPTVCAGSLVNLTAVGFGGTPGYTYTWTNGPVSPVFTTGQPAGSYPFVVTGKDFNNCTATQTQVVTFIAYPVLGVTNSTLCQGNMGTLTASGASSYTWYPGGYAGSSYPVGPLFTSAYTVVGSIQGCNSTAGATVTVHPLPFPGISSNNNVCEGSSILLSGSGNGAYVWAGPAGYASIGASATVTAVSLLNGGNYSLTVTDGNGCSATTSTLITILAQPQITVTGAGVCIGESASIMASGGVSYTWSGPNGFSASIPNPLIPVVTASSSGIYTVSVGDNSCTATATTQVVGYPYPLPVVSTSATTKVCVNSAIKLQGLGGVTYTWSGPNNYNATQQNVSFIAGSLAASGIYTLNVKNIYNCAASGTVFVTVYPQPEGVLLSDMREHCIPFCSTFSFVASSTNTAPVLSTNFFVDNRPIAFSDFNHCFQKAGEYKVSVIFTDTNGCAKTSDFFVTAYPLPIADFSFLPETPVESFDPVIFTNMSKGENLQKYTWYFTDHESGKSTTKNTTYLYEEAGSYPVALVVKNSWGCTDTMVKVVVIDTDFSLYVPNAFTPNGSGLNDVFQPKGRGIVNYQLHVFDRWGEKLFSSKDFYTGWDGTYKGVLCKSDTYVWEITVTNAAGKTKRYLGHVSLVN